MDEEPEETPIFEDMEEERLDDNTDDQQSAWSETPQEEAAAEDYPSSANSANETSEPSSPESHSPSQPTHVQQPHTPCEPKELVNQGISFLSGLAETLKSPEATQQLIDNIVEVDSETGQTNIKIPVASKENVSNVLQLIGKLFGGFTPPATH